jgi:hypothetical protein
MFMIGSLLLEHVFPRSPMSNAIGSNEPYFPVLHRRGVFFQARLAARETLRIAHQAGALCSKDLTRLDTTNCSIKKAKMVLRLEDSRCLGTSRCLAKSCH